MTAARPPSNPKGSVPSDAAPLPDDVERGSDDGVLDSLGKAIASPVRGAAEPEEPGGGARKRPVAPG